MLISLEMKDMVDTFLPDLKLYGGKKISPVGWACDSTGIVLAQCVCSCGAIPGMA